MIHVFYAVFLTTGSEINDPFLFFYLFNIFFFFFALKRNCLAITKIGRPIWNI